MVVPKEISPIDYFDLTNEYGFMINDFALRVNYTTKVFELLVNYETSYTESFSIVEFPPEWLEVIDFGLVDWIRLALKWKMDFAIQFKLENQLYSIEYNTRNHELLFQVEGRTISTARNSLTTVYPELQYWEEGKLLTKITDFVIDEICNNENNEEKPVATQGGLKFKYLVVNQNYYEIGYSKEFDRILLIVPKQSLYGNLLHIEKDLPWISEMNSGAMYDIIRDTITGLAAPNEPFSD
jgi:hypothetical protein